ncbi:Mg2+-importing ATPase [bacterium A37T11]|nr:Mg2+-importing ATPase [bacterium A37T11]
MIPEHFSQLPAAVVAERLHTSLEQGLTETEAAKRLANQGKNKSITSSRFMQNLKLLVAQFTSPLVILLIVAVILSAILGETTDTLIMLSILLITGFLGFAQELNAGNAIEKLQAMIRLHCMVIREGKQTDIETDAVVPGDLLLLRAGDIIPADCRLVACNELHVNESSMTGESYPVEKNPAGVADDAPLAGKLNCLWQGTSVISGTAKAIAVNTAANTLFGQMTGSLSQTVETSFEKGIKHFGYFLMQITIVLSMAILGINLYFHKPVFDSILFALAIAVGMAPELLPAIITFSLSAGARRMLAKKVIVKKLSSIFNFGEVQVLCTDKTGTITEGAVAVKEVVNALGLPDKMAEYYAYLNATLQNGFLNPIDLAIQQLKLEERDFQKTDEIPYDFIRKRLSVVVESTGNHLLITKGAVENILEICSYQQNPQGVQIKLDTVNIMALYQKYCSEGFRLLGLCSKETSGPKVTRDDEKEMVFLGFVVLEDPLKEGVLDSIERLRGLNVQVKIITGDNPYVASYVAHQLAIPQPRILTGKDLDQILPEALVVKAAQTDIFAEVEPHQKERIIKALQQAHLTVAYMGDGINDVAAIHAADTGISTSNAVDVAKQSADFVLLEKDLSVLADGIAEGRKTFANSVKYILITTGATFGNMFSVAGASLLLPFLPMLPKQILFTNFLTDMPFLAVSGDHVDPEQVKSPGKWDLKMIRNFMIVFGLHSSIFDFLTFYLLYYVYHLTSATFRTGWFVESILTELFILFIMRTQKLFLKSMPAKWLLIAGIACFALTLWLPASPFAESLGLCALDGTETLIVASIVLVYVITADLLKRLFFYIHNKNAS